MLETRWPSALRAPCGGAEAPPVRLPGSPRHMLHHQPAAPSPIPAAARERRGGCGEKAEEEFWAAACTEDGIRRQRRT
jgi:hypothetical protein